MGTTVVGFRLGWDRKGRQATVVLTQAGILHHGSGLLGMPQRPARPQAPAAADPHPVPRQAATLRRVYAGLVHQGYGRELIPPVCVRLDTDERPLHPRGEHAPRAHPELIAEFTGAAPCGPGTLDDALTAFYTAIGLTPPAPAATPPPGPGGVPPAVRRALGALAEGRTLASRPGRGTGWSVTGAGVRLHAGPGGADLTHREVAELQAALTAWLRHQRGPGAGARAR
ncbi:hypothetical protein [Streptomyces sp. W1SF4]|uniref:hypothetical protein n=1 Tax=Streptomyces sp. W1SF4 TaxID=2305220 RepID=UPI000F6EBDE0|nr:hypothetical protein [Streptomyces sp. W1SF4]AZM87331.1 hypothetical protein D1J60_01460 [Streptomyces sp. W1SF4]